MISKSAADSGLDPHIPSAARSRYVILRNGC